MPNLFTHLFYTSVLLGLCVNTQAQWSTLAQEVIEYYRADCETGDYRDVMGDEWIKELGIKNKKPVLTVSKDVVRQIQLNDNTWVEVVDPSETYCDTWGIARIAGNAKYWDNYLIVGNQGYIIQTSNLLTLKPSDPTLNMKNMLLWSDSAYACFDDIEKKGIHGYHGCWTTAYWEDHLDRFVFSSGVDDAKASREYFNRRIK